MVGVIGRSGAGKSTLLRMINRLTDATSGAVHFSRAAT
jgi:phosphonate transport system ATP-binding protein